MGKRITYTLNVQRGHFGNDFNGMKKSAFVTGKEQIDESEQM